LPPGSVKCTPMQISGMTERREIRLPDFIRRIVGDRPYTVDSVGLSDSAVLLFDDAVLKIRRHTPDTEEEVRMMRWLRDRLPVPEVLCYGTEAGKSYLLMRRVPGRMACDPYPMGRPAETVRALADGLRMLWNTDISGCPRECRPEEELAEARRRVEAGIPDFEGDSEFPTPEALLSWLEDHLPPYDPVLSHGDFCLPNVFLENGAVCGMIDLGGAGVADRYRDIADCYGSIVRNTDGTYGVTYPAFDPNLFLQELGISPEDEKLRYWLLLQKLF